MINHPKEEQEFPDESFFGEFKSHTSKNNFVVVWWNVDTNTTTTAPGIYIKLCQPNQVISENIFFPFGNENDAEKKYQEFVKKVDSWDQIT